MPEPEVALGVGVAMTVVSAERVALGASELLKQPVNMSVNMSVNIGVGARATQANNTDETFTTSARGCKRARVSKCTPKCAQRRVSDLRTTYFPNFLYPNEIGCKFCAECGVGTQVIRDVKCLLFNNTFGPDLRISSSTFRRVLKIA